MEKNEEESNDITDHNGSISNTLAGNFLSEQKASK